MDEIFKEFKSESMDLISQMLNLLEEAEEGLDKKDQLEQVGQIVDRIMGGAKTMDMVLKDQTYINKVGQYAEICKIVGYKGSQIDNPDFYNVVVAFLLDAVEMLEDIVKKMGTEDEVNIQATLSETFLDRLKWIDGKFEKGLRGSLALDKKKKEPTQGDIDLLLKELGVE